MQVQLTVINTPKNMYLVAPLINEVQLGNTPQWKYLRRRGVRADINTPKNMHQFTQLINKVQLENTPLWKYLCRRGARTDVNMKKKVQTIT